MEQGLLFIAGMLAFAGAAALLGGVLGVAYGIESERRFKRPRPTPAPLPSPGPDPSPSLSVVD
jgi:hypothetical protein